MSKIHSGRQTPYYLLATNIAMNMLKETPEGVDPLKWRQSWEHIAEEDYTLQGISCINDDVYTADILFHRHPSSGVLSTLFKTVSLHEFISYMAVRRALEKSHVNLLTETYLRRNGTEIECVVPRGYNFDNGFMHNDWLFPKDMFIIKNESIVFYSPIIKGWARIIYT